MFTFRVNYQLTPQDDVVLSDDIVATGYRFNHDGTLEFYRKIGPEVVVAPYPQYGNPVPTYYSEDGAASGNSTLTYPPTYENIAVYPSGVWKKVERLQPVEEIIE